MFGKLTLSKEDTNAFKEVFKQHGLGLAKSRWPDPKSMPSEEVMMSELLGKSKGSMQFKMIWKGLKMTDEDYREIVTYIRNERLKEVG